MANTNKEKNVKLSVKDLSISFRTNQGMVRAVRGVSFDLYEGETLAIVGESGSGKSVTNRAIMGILAGNAVIEKGSILYEGQDLAKMDEENFHKIRGHKIGMIFQDPLSSLNPIMRIGKQVTEGMLINGDRLKNRVKALSHETSVALANAKYEKTVIIRTYKEEVAKLKENGEKEKIAALKTKYQADLEDINKKIKEAAAAHRVKVKESKAQVKQDWQAKKAETKQIIAKVREKFATATTDEEKKAIRKEIFEIKEECRRYAKVTKREARERAIQVMREVGIPEPEKRMKQYPFQFSGGMRQRIVIAIALTANPDILICDEPTTALDVTIQAQILDLIKKLKQERNLTVIFITHDLGVVAHMADRVAVMYAGKIVEIGTADEIFYTPAHPYTWALLSSMPDLNSSGRLTSIPGTPPNMLFPPKGDAFAERSQYAMKIDFEQEPPFFKITDTHYAATWLLHKDAPKVEMPKVIQERIKAYMAVNSEEGVNN